MSAAPLRWTLSGFGDEIDPEPATQLAVLQALGSRHLEFRSAWGRNVADLGDDDIDRVAALLDRAGMRVSAVASPIGKVPIEAPAEDEIARLRRILEIARRLDAPYVRVFSFFTGPDPDAHRDAVLHRMRLLADEGERADVVLVHENEKEIYGDVPSRVLDIVESVGSSHLRLAWDNANFVQVGVRPFDEGYTMLRSHIEYLQVKDAVAATGAVVPAGRGDGQLLETLTALRDDGYSGFASLEPHLDSGHLLGGFSGPRAFGTAARAFAALLDRIGVSAGLDTAA